MPTKDAPDFVQPLMQIARQQVVNVSNAVDLTINLGSLRSATIPTTDLVDGQVWVYQDASAGIRWTFEYNSSSASTYKWEFAGGAALINEVTTSETTASTTFAALATAGPAIVLPFAGDYDVTIAAQLTNDTNGCSAVMSYDIGGTGAVDADGVNAGQPAGGNTLANVSRTRRKTGLTAVTLTAKYRRAGGGTTTASQRWMSVLPVRVG